MMSFEEYLKKDGETMEYCEHKKSEKKKDCPFGCANVRK